VTTHLVVIVLKI